MARAPIPTWYFALTVVRHGDKFLLVHERKHGQKWYLPAGRVEPGERFVDAARRETLEESGVAVVIEGILRVEHTPHSDGTARCRVFFVARPEGAATPKTVADVESLGAAWVTLAELPHFSLRGEEVRHIFEHVAAGGAVYPLTMLVVEGERF